MKKSIFLFVLIAGMTTFLFSEDTYPKLKVSGRVLMELHSDNNMTDYHDFADSTYNDKDGYGKGRVDLNFTSQLTANIKAQISTRFESENADKWMYFGKIKSTDGTNTKVMEKARPALQEAFVQYDNLFINGLSFDLGRRSFSYGKKNIVADKDKLDGMHLQYTSGNFTGDLHYIIRDNAADFASTEDGRDQNLFGLVGTAKKLANVANVSVYFWNQSQNYNAATDAEALSDAITVIGFRGDAAVALFKPYVEFAMQSGTKDKGATVDGQAKDLTYSGYLLDLGTTAEMPVNEMTAYGELELLLASGNDKDTADENEGWRGVKLGNREEGYKYTNPANYNDNTGMMMLKLNAGLKFNAKTSAALTFWSYNDNSSNYKWTKDGKELEYSGKNIFNELNLEVSHSLEKTARIYAGVSMIMPNADYPILGSTQTTECGDTATGLYLGSEIKF
jgi:hypothetical protein